MMVDLIEYVVEILVLKNFDIPFQRNFFCGYGYEFFKKVVLLD